MEIRVLPEGSLVYRQSCRADSLVTVSYIIAIVHNRNDHGKSQGYMHQGASLLYVQMKCAPV